MNTDLQLPPGSWTKPLIALTAGAVAVCAIYLPDLGHGFLRDDFRWIRVGHLGSASDVVRVFASEVGFYRPLVLASFGLEHALFGLAPFPYGLTNLLLLFACAGLLVRLSRALRLTPVAAVAAALIWMLNFHAVSMALLWFSGRTALFLALFGLLAALSTIAGRRWWAAGWCLLALLSKEEAVVFPFVLAAWTWYSTERDTAVPARRTAHQSWPMFAALALYAVLRIHSGAFGPATAPSYYQFTTSIPLLLRNVGEYFDRACTVSVAVGLIAFAVCRHRLSLTTAETRACAFGALWLVCGFAITVFLPVRSDLYALAPSLGAALAAGVVIQWAERVEPARMRRTLTVLAVLPFVLIPVYRARNVRWVAPANISARVVSDLERDAATLPAGAQVVLVDDPSAGRPLQNAFGGLLPDAMTIVIGRGVTGTLVDEMAQVPASAGSAEAIYAFRAGTLVRVRLY